MQITPRKTKSAATPKSTRKRGQGRAKTDASAPTQEAIEKAVHDYMAAHYDSLLGLAAIARSAEIDAMFAEIDRNPDASEQITAQLLSSCAPDDSLAAMFADMDSRIDAITARTDRLLAQYG